VRGLQTCPPVQVQSSAQLLQPSPASASHVPSPQPTHVPDWQVWGRTHAQSAAHVVQFSPNAESQFPSPHSMQVFMMQFAVGGHAQSSPGPPQFPQFSPGPQVPSVQPGQTPAAQPGQSQSAGQLVQSSPAPQVPSPQPRQRPPVQIKPPVQPQSASQVPQSSGGSQDPLPQPVHCLESASQVLGGTHPQSAGQDTQSSVLLIWPSLQKPSPQMSMQSTGQLP
jgi:hypothetical protein